MRFNKLFIISLCALAILWAAGCSGSQVKDEISPEMAALPAYFQEVPADTLFFFGGAEPIPRELLADTFKAFNALVSWDSGGPSAPDYDDFSAGDRDDGFTLAMSAGSSPEALLESALQFMSEEMGGEISAEGLENLGIAREPLAAAYAVGYLPVIRLELGDAQKFSAFVERFEQRYELEPEILSLEEQSYRAYSNDVDSARILLRITDDEVIASVANDEVLERFLPYFLGLAKPKRSMAHDNRFGKMVEKSGFLPYAAAYLDMERVTAWIARDFGVAEGEPMDINEEILSTLDLSEEMALGPTCAAEYRRVAAMAPLIVGGVREYDEKTVDIAGGITLDPELARRFVETVSGVPGANTTFAEKALFSMGVGIDLAATLDFLEAQAREIEQQPYECEEFQELNEFANNIRMVSGQIPPAIRSFRGLNIVLRNMLLGWKADQPHEGQLIPRILLAIRSDDPGAMLQMAGMFVPEEALDEDIKPDGEPVALEMLTMFYEGLVEPMLVMTNQGLALMAGPGMLDGAKKIVDAEQTKGGAALLIRFNGGEPLTEFLAEAERMVSEASSQADERGLSAEDIALAQEGLKLIERSLPTGPATMALSLEANHGGLLLAWRSQGESGIVDTLRTLNEGDDASLEALARVLNLD